MRSRAPLLIVIATTGCLNEYHPEFHPVTNVAIVKNVSSPTTIITENQIAASSPPSIESSLPRSSVNEDSIERSEIQPKRAPIATARKSSACPLPTLPMEPGSTELGPNVSIGPGVSFGGNVYVSGDLIIGGTREHPQLITR